MIRLFFDAFFPSTERLDAYLSKAKDAFERYSNAADVYARVLHEIKEVHGPDAINVKNKAIMAAHTAYDKATTDLGKRITRYSFLKQRCLKRGIFPEDTHEEEMRFRYRMKRENVPSKLLP